MAESTVLPNDFGSHLTSWLGQQGYRLPAVPAFRFVPGMTGGTSAPEGISFSERWQPQVTRLASRYGSRGRLPGPDLSALKVMLHEMLHQPLVHREPDWYGNATPDQRLWEEAAAEQGAVDLLPAAAKQLFGHAYRPPAPALGGPDAPPGRRVVGRRIADRPTAHHLHPERNAREQAYRQMSVFGSGAGNFNERPARLWRRNYANAPTTIRAQMEAEAMAKRGAA